MADAKTIFDKIWESHVVAERDDGASLLYIDRLLLQENTFHAFDKLRREGRAVRNPEQAFAFADHYVPTLNREQGLDAIADPRTPAEAFGFNPGDDYKLASYDQLESYYRELAAESDRVQLREIGHSALGRTLYRLRILTHTRDFVAFHNMLVARGLAVHAGEPLRPPTGEVPDDLAIAVQRIVSLVEKA